MSEVIGSVPLYKDASGNVYVDQEDVSEGVGAMFPVRRERRLGRRLDRLGRRESRIRDRLDDEDEEVIVQQTVQKMEQPADIYAAAAASGMIQENQFEGLGSTPILAGGTGALTDTVNRNIWVKSIVLDSDATGGAAFLLVTAITFAGLPVNIGSLGAPLRMFAHDSTRFGINFGRRLALTGQQIRITFSNVDSSAHTVSGSCICDELNPYAMQKWMEWMLLQAAVSGFRGTF